MPPQNAWPPLTGESAIIPSDASKENSMQRRTLLKWLAAAPLASHALAAPPKDLKGIEAMQKNWKDFLPAGAKVPAATEQLTLTKDEWKKRLQGQAYSVLREED